MCSGGGIGDFFGDLLNIATLGMAGTGTADKALRSAQAAQNRAQQEALSAAQAAEAQERAKTEAATAAQEELDKQRKTRSQQSYLTGGGAAGDIDTATGIRKSYLGAAQQ